MIMRAGEGIAFRMAGLSRKIVFQGATDLPTPTNGGRSGFAGDGGRDYAGSDFGSSGPMERRPAAGNSSGGGGKFSSSDMDDEIPF